MVEPNPRLVGVATTGPPPSAADAESLFAGEPGNHANAVLSPDSRLIAYQSDERGQFESYVRAWNGKAAVGVLWSVRDLRVRV